jgi:hypothetical protein
MYSYEIAKLLKLRYNLISIKEYMEICNSPQVDHIKYEDEQFKVWTNDGYTFTFRIRRN